MQFKNDKRELTPLVTVIIPVYNAGCYLRASIESIVKQTYKNLQIIIIDDGSTDNCMQTIQDIHDSRIIFLNQSNSGKSVALNNALRIAKGKYYTIQDADDLSYNNRIQTLVAVMESAPHLSAVFSGYDLIFKEKRIAPLNTYKNEKICKKDIQQFRMPSHDPTGFYRLAMIKELEYDPVLRIGQGYDYILRIGEKYPIIVINKTLYSYRITETSTTRFQSERRITMLSLVWEKACRRNDINYDNWKKNNIKRITPLNTNDKHYGIVSHCMESVISLKKEHKFFHAFKVGLQCCNINPVNYYYYKPIIYFITPIIVISLYRNLKASNIIDYSKK